MPRFASIVIFIWCGLCSAAEFVNYTNKDNIRDIAIHEDTVWSATTGGIAVWGTGGELLKTYTTADGLADNYLEAMAIDAEGVKWFGTDQGVSAFDGVSWTNYASGNSGLVNDEVHSVAAGSDGVVWFGTDGGVSSFDGTDWTTYTEAGSGLIGNIVNCITIDPQGVLWFGTNSGVCSFNGTDWTVPPQGTAAYAGGTWSGTNISFNLSEDGTRITKTGSTIENNAALAVRVVLSSGGCSGASAMNLYIYNDILVSNGKFSYTDYRCTITGTFVAPDQCDGYVEYQEQDVTCIYGTGYFKGSGSWSASPLSGSTPQAQGLPCDTVVSIAIDAAGNKWCGTDRGGVAMFDGTNWTIYNKINSGLAGDYVRSVEFSDDGAVWVGTSSGISMFDGTNWTTYTTADGLASSSIFSVAVAGDGTVWCGTFAGLSAFDGSTWSAYAIEEGPGSNFVAGMAVGSNGAIWSMNILNTSCFDRTTWSTYIPPPPFSSPPDPLSPSPSYLYLYPTILTAVAIDRDSSKWFGTMFTGVCRFDGATWESYDTADGLVSNFVISIAVDSSGTKWFGTDTGVSTFDGTNWTTYTAADGLLSDFVKVIAVESDGTKWFGTGNGVSSFDGTAWTSYTPSDGLAGGSVQAINFEAGGEKWFGTTAGVSRFDGTNWQTYTTADGLANDTVSAIAIDGSGAKWFGTKKGVSHFDGTTWSTYTQADGLADDNVGCAVTDTAGNAWFGTHCGISMATPSLPVGAQKMHADHQSVRQALSVRRTPTRLVIDYRSRHPGCIEVALFNMHGRCVRRATQRTGRGQGRVAFGITALPAGNYIALVKAGPTAIRKAVVVAK